MVVEEANVCATVIFVAPDTKKERQIVVYKNNVDTHFEKNLMVLAVPNPETVDFIDLSNYTEFFDDVTNYYLRHSIKKKSFGGTVMKGERSNTLEVHEVGNFLASICKNIDDLKNINSETFGQIGNDALEFMINKYSDTDYGFIVCKLKKGNYNYHPFAYSHKISNNKLFIPTMHYHGDEKQRIENQVNMRKEYSQNEINDQLKVLEKFKKVNGSLYSEEFYQNKMDNILNRYKEIVLNYDWDHNIFIVNNHHDDKEYEKNLDKKMFKNKVNFDIGDISAISKIVKIGMFSNGDTMVDVKS